MSESTHSGQRDSQRDCLSQPGNSYEDRKSGLVCTYSAGCGKPATDDSALCKRHAKTEPKRTRASMRAIRAARRAMRQCAECGESDSRTKSGLYRCHVCSTRLAATQASVTDSVTAFEEQLERIRSRTFLEADGRTRYRGRLRRGRQSVEDLDAKDRAIIGQYLAKYDAGIAYARRPEAADVPRIQRDAAQREARSYLRTAARFANEILVRNGDDPVTYVADDDCDDVTDDEGETT